MRKSKTKKKNLKQPKRSFEKTGTLESAAA